MKTRMTPLSTAMLAASMLLATSTLSTPAMAAPPGPPNGPAPEMQGEHKPDRRADHMAGHPADRWEKRMADLHASLKLTSAQTPAWETYHAALKPPVRTAQAGREDSQREEWAKLKTPERLDRLRAGRQERDTTAAQREEATRTFYATLNAEQQKTFDARTVHPFFGEEPGRPTPR